MTTAGRRGILAVALAVLLLAFGAVAAILVGGAVATHALVAPADGEPSAASDPLMAWLARVLLALAVAWLLIGIVATRTSLVRRPGAAAARASWLAATRPWRARESTLGMLALDRWLLLFVPVALLVATRAVQSSLGGWLRLVVVVCAWAVFALVLRVVVGVHSPWPVIAAVGGVVVLRCVLTLAVLAVNGPGGYWYAFWEYPAARGTYITVASALFLWLFVAAAWSLFAQLGAARGIGAVLCASGVALAVPAWVVSAVGLERTLAVWDERAGLLPWGLSRLVAAALRMHLPEGLVWWGVGIGAAMAVAGALLALRGSGSADSPAR
ncbi:hypothetical protein [Microbacterium luticocti]|uniref:hypothetical protein n=1 Tax=Microbacterium luticocti TaxID=451764 RepID=UPI000405925E|nr:hypothetical protein [Microbacterium luticocti]